MAGVTIDVKVVCQTWRCSDSKRVRCFPQVEHRSFVIAPASIPTSRRRIPDGMDADLETVSLDVLNIVFCFRDGNGLECLEVYPWRGKVYSIRFDFGGSVSEGS